MSKMIESLLRLTDKTLEQLQDDLSINNQIQSMKLPQIEPSPLEVKVKPPTAMEIYNRLDRINFEINVLPQTALYLEHLKRMFNIESDNIEEIIDKSIIFLYESLNNELK